MLGVGDPVDIVAGDGAGGMGQAARQVPGRQLVPLLKDRDVDLPWKS
jgi:hypothetical protein